MKWESIIRIYDALIGKVLVIFSVISILTIIAPIKLMIEGINTSISLLGAIIISMSYALYKVYAPNLILYYKSPNEYIKTIVDQSLENHLDTYVEFEIIERVENISTVRELTANNPLIRDASISVADLISSVEQSRALECLAFLKYEIINRENTKCRWIITVSSFIGVSMMYWPSIARIFSTLIGGFR